MGITFT